MLTFVYEGTCLSTCCYDCDDCNFATQIYLKGRRHEGRSQLNWCTNRFNGLNICMSCTAHLCSVHTFISSHVRGRPTLKCFLNSRININKNNKNKFQTYSCLILNILRQRTAAMSVIHPARAWKKLFATMTCARYLSIKFVYTSFFEDTILACI